MGVELHRMARVDCDVSVDQREFREYDTKGEEGWQVWREVLGTVHYERPGALHKGTLVPSSNLDKKV